eukprot:PhM_4_TR15879/c0_g1_i1/m.84857
MGLNLADMFKCALLLLNAMAVLSERRFLAKWGLAVNSSSGNNNISSQGGDGGDYGTSLQLNDSNSLKGALRNVLGSVRLLLRMPLIITNGVMIMFALVFG